MKQLFRNGNYTCWKPTLWSVLLPIPYFFVLSLFIRRQRYHLLFRSHVSENDLNVTERRLYYCTAKKKNPYRTVMINNSSYFSLSRHE